MKFSKTTYLSLFFLFCFTASFSVNAWQNMQVRKHVADFTNHDILSISAKETASGANTNLLLEKSENETEKCLSVQSFYLPSYLSYFQFEAAHQRLNFSEILTEKLTYSIYIQICNFRI